MANPPVCSIPDCGKPAVGQGWCHLHYMRWRRHGDPLIVKKPRGEVPRYFREVVLTYRGHDCLPWPYTRDQRGYGKMQHDGRMQYVSRVACEHVNGPPPTPKHEAAHSCGKGHEGCCTPRHMSWKTHAGNKADMIAHGTSQRGERQWMSKLTAAQVLEIRAMIGTMPQRRIAERFGVSFQTISSIRCGKNWGWLSDRQPG